MRRPREAVVQPARRGWDADNPSAAAAGPRETCARQSPPPATRQASLYALAHRLTHGRRWQPTPYRHGHGVGTCGAVRRMASLGDHEDGHDDGGDDNTLLAEETVDESQLKLPSFKWDETNTSEVKSLEEDEEVLFKE
jgi:hypothetical protein